MFEDVEIAASSHSSSFSFEDENSKIALAWENVSFTIPGKKGKEDREILSNVFGHVEPGQVRRHPCYLSAVDYCNNGTVWFRKDVSFEHPFWSSYFW